MGTYQEILDEVLPLYRQDPERFMRFYHAVNNILATIPEGKSILIADHCKPACILLKKQQGKMSWMTF